MPELVAAANHVVILHWYGDVNLVAVDRLMLSEEIVCSLLQWCQRLSAEGGGRTRGGLLLSFVPLDALDQEVHPVCPGSDVCVHNPAHVFPAGPGPPSEEGETYPFPLSSATRTSRLREKADKSAVLLSRYER